MHRFCLAILRFGTSAWLGIALYFNLVILDVLDSALTERLTTSNHPGLYLPPYDGLALGLLGAALACACIGLWNPDDAPLRKFATVLIVFAAFGLALADYVLVDRRILEILKTPTAIPAAQFVELYAHSRFLKEMLLLLSAASTFAAFWPVPPGHVENRNAETASG